MVKAFTEWKNVIRIQKIFKIIFCNEKPVLCGLVYLSNLGLLQHYDPFYSTVKFVVFKYNTVRVSTSLDFDGTRHLRSK